MATTVLVEGPSDAIAVGCVAARARHPAGVEVVAIGGAQAARREVAKRGVTGVLALCDAAEARWFLAALPADRVFVCHADLEDELIRAVGAGGVIELLEEHGDLRAFRTLQHQTAWSGRALEAQLRRWMGSGARRKVRYAELLTEAAVAVGRVPAPLAGVVAAAGR